jgi:hypothetical protein
MSALENLSTAELQHLAHEWREKALRGVKEARAAAHAHEAELRRRLGQSWRAATTASLDLRPLDQRSLDAHRPWWRFW